MDVDALYGAPLEEFVAQRGALVKQLRQEGRRDEAAQVASLRKPSVAAWAVNQLIRTQTTSVAELFAAGDALREAHRTATSGHGDGQALRTAAQRERAAVEALIEAARGLLTSDGHELSETVIERVADTLRAAALDSEARGQVQGGRLERELRHVGLGVVSDIGTAPPSPSKTRQPKTRTPARDRRAPEEGRRQQSATAQEQARRRTEQAAREAEAKAQRRAAREAEASARRRAERADRAVRVAQERRDRAAQELRAAEERLAEAVAEAEAARDAHARARDDLERA